MIGIPQFGFLKLLFFLIHSQIHFTVGTRSVYGPMFGTHTTDATMCGV